MNKSVLYSNTTSSCYRKFLPSHPCPFVTPVPDALEMANLNFSYFHKGQMGVEFTITLEEQ